MNKLILLTMIFMSGYINAQDCTSLIKVTAEDSSVYIFIDGKEAGKGSAAIEVKPGIHYVTARRNPREWSLNEKTDSVRIADCGITSEIKLTSKAAYYLNTIPQNADVFYKDSLIGKTPIYLSSGISLVELKKQDYRSMTVNSSDLKGNSIIKMEFLGEGEKESFMRSNIFKVLIGTAAVLGGTAAYYKLKANDQFDEYNLTGSQAALDKTNKYDTVSGIAFGALQVNFGIILYYLLTD